jgi:hypothetical protein
MMLSQQNGINHILHTPVIGKVSAGNREDASKWPAGL